MKSGDYIVIGLSLLIALFSTMDDISYGFSGFAYEFGYFCGGLIECLIVGYIVLFAYRYIRDTFFPVKVAEVKKED